MNMLFGDFRKGLIALVSSDVHMNVHYRSISPTLNYDETRTPSAVGEAHAEFKLGVRHSEYAQTRWATAVGDA